MTNVDRKSPRVVVADSHRDQAATTVQRAWRSRAERRAVAHATRNDLVIFEIDGRRLAGVRSKILGADRSPKLTNAILARSERRKGPSSTINAGPGWVGRRRDLGLKAMSKDAASCLIDYLEGEDLFVAPPLAEELHAVARRYDVPGLAADMQLFLDMNRPDAGWEATARKWIGHAALALMLSKDVDKTCDLFLNKGYKWSTIGIYDGEGDARRPVGEVRCIEATGRGDLPPAVFLHGVTSSSVRSPAFLEALRNDHRTVIAIDHPGHGDSTVPPDGLTAATVLRGGFQALDHIAARFGPLSLIGNSMGGWVAAHYKLARPENVFSLSLFEPAGAPMTLRERQRNVVDFAPTNVSTARRFVGRLHLPDWQRPLAPFVHVAQSASVSHQQLVGSAKDARCFRRDELREKLGDVLLVLGTRDAVFAPGVKAFWRKNVSEGSRILEPSHVGHCPNLDAPSWAAGVVADWARRTAE